MREDDIGARRADACAGTEISWGGCGESEDFVSRKGGVGEGDGRREGRGGDVERTGHCIHSKDEDFAPSAAGKRRMKGRKRREIFLTFRYSRSPRTRSIKKRKAIRESRTHANDES